MGTPFLAEMRVVSFNFAPKGWAFCNGQLLAINQNQALFSLLGTNYGGDGRTNFALPNLQGAAALHFNATFPLGAIGGETSHALTVNEMPAHVHTAAADPGSASQVSPAGHAWSNSGQQLYAATPDTTMAATAVTTAGSSVPHENMPPYLVLNVIIALQGIFPSR